MRGYRSMILNMRKAAVLPYAYKVCQMLLSHKHIDVNASNLGNDTALSRLAKDVNESSSGVNTRTLDQMCANNQKCALGLELLLNDHRTEVNKGTIINNPLFNSLKNVESEGDYLYKVTQMLLRHKDIDVNALVYGNDTILSQLAYWGYKSFAGIRLLLEHRNIHVCKSDSVFIPIKWERNDLLEPIIKHRKFKVNKKCERCKSRLPITYFESDYNFKNLAGMWKPLEID